MNIVCSHSCLIEAVLCCVLYSDDESGFDATIRWQTVLSGSTRPRRNFADITDSLELGKYVTYVETFTKREKCYYSAPDRWAEYIVMSVSLCMCMCLCVCLSAIISSSELHVRSSPIFCKLPMAVARPSSGVVVIRYVFPVLWMTSYLHISWGCSKLPPGWGSEAYTQPWAWRVGIPVAGSGRSGLHLAVRTY